MERGQILPVPEGSAVKKRKPDGKATMQRFEERIFSISKDDLKKQRKPLKRSSRGRSKAPDPLVGTPG